MSKLSQPQRVFELLKQSPLKKFKARDIANRLLFFFLQEVKFHFQSDFQE